MATREHLIPRVFNGPTEWWNLVAACSECNTLRGHMSAHAFFWMRQHMSTHEIRVLRYGRLILAFDRYEKKTIGGAIVVFAFLHRLFGHEPALPAVALKR